MEYFKFIFVFLIFISCNSHLDANRQRNKDRSLDIKTENIHKPLKTECLREYFKSWSKINNFTHYGHDYIPLLTVYDSNDKIHCYIYLTQHVGHKDFFKDIDPLVEKIISKVDKVYFEIEAKNDLFQWADLLYTTRWSDDVMIKQAFELIELRGEDKKKFKDYFFSLEEKFKKIYQNYVASVGIDSKVLFHACPQHVMSFLEQFEEPEYFYSVESEIEKYILKYKKKTDGLENPVFKNDDELAKEYIKSTNSFIRRCYKSWKLLNDISINYEEKVKKNYAGLYYLGTMFHLINDSEINKEDTKRHNLWIPKIIKNKNTLYCFGGRHLFSNGSDSIYNQLTSRGFKLEFSEPKKILYETLSKGIKLDLKILDKVCEKLKNYSHYYMAKLYKGIAKILNNAGRADVSPMFIERMKPFIQNAMKEKNKVGFTEQDLDNLIYNSTEG